MKDVYRVSTKQHGDMGTWNQASCDPKTQPFCKLGVLAHCLARIMWKSNYPHRQVAAIALHVFVAATVKLQKFIISEPHFSPSEQGSNWHHQLRLSSLFPWHIMISALRHN